MGNSINIFKKKTNRISSFAEELKSSNLNLNDRLDHIIKCQKDDNLIIDVGGKEYKISKDTIRNSKYKHNHFTSYLDKREVFVDRNNKYFDLILQILRYSSVKEFFVKENINLVHRIASDQKDPALERELLFYFKDEYKSLIEDFCLVGFKYKDVSNKLQNTIVLENPYKNDKLIYMNYIVNDADELSKDYCRRGVFLDAGGSVTFTLSTDTLVNKISIRPFTFDMDIFDYTHCTNIEVYSVVNNKEFLIGAFNLKELKNPDKTYDLLLVKSIKALKFKSDKPFSISYLGIFQKERAK